MNKSEALAKHIIENIITGSEATYIEKQHNANYDFKLSLPGKDKYVALEVTQSTDEQKLKTLKAATKNAIKAPKLGYNWLLISYKDARIKDIKEKAEEQLSKIEEQFPDEKLLRKDLFPEICSKLNIEVGFRHEETSDPKIKIGAPVERKGGIVSGYFVTQAAIEEAYNKDNRKNWQIPASRKGIYLF